MHIEVIPTFQKIEPPLTEGKICIAIDTLRATSTIVTALQHGCKEIIPADTPQIAAALHKSKSRYILGGESDGKPPPVFLRGNSPQEYTTGLENQSVIFVTTNGTRTITKLHKAKCTVICSLLNIGEVAKWLKNCAGGEVLICCAGTRVRLALEDFYTAGGIIKRVAAKRTTQRRAVYLSEFAFFSKNFYTVAKKRYNGNIQKLFQNSLNGKRLVEMGMSSDLDFCCRENVYKVLPFYTNGVIKTENRLAAPLETLS